MIVSNNGAELMRILVEAGSNVNDTDKSGSTALLISSEIGNLGCVEFLLKNGCDVNASNNQGIPPLFMAAQMGLILISRPRKQQKQQHSDRHPSNHHHRSHATNIKRTQRCV